MILTKPDSDNTDDEYSEKRERLLTQLSDDQRARQMRSRRRQLLILRRMIADKEGRSDGR